MTDDIEELESRAILKNIQFKDEVYTKKEADDAISAAVKTNSVDLEDYAKKNDLSAYSKKFKLDGVELSDGSTTKDLKIARVDRDEIINGNWMMLNDFGECKLGLAVLDASSPETNDLIPFVTIEYKGIGNKNHHDVSYDIPYDVTNINVHKYYDIKNKIDFDIKKFKKQFGDTIYIKLRSEFDRFVIADDQSSVRNFTINITHNKLGFIIYLAGTRIWTEYGEEYHRDETLAISSKDMIMIKTRNDNSLEYDVKGICCDDRNYSQAFSMDLLQMNNKKMVICADKARMAGTFFKRSNCAYDKICDSFASQSYVDMKIAEAIAKLNQK